MPKPHVRQKYQYLFSGQLKEEHTPFKLQIGLKNIRKKGKDEAGETEAFSLWHPAQQGFLSQTDAPYSQGLLMTQVPTAAEIISLAPLATERSGGRQCLQPPARGLCPIPIAPVTDQGGVERAVALHQALHQPGGRLEEGQPPHCPVRLLTKILFFPHCFVSVLFHQTHSK